jgi:hypothetical protein
LDRKRRREWVWGEVQRGGKGLINKFLAALEL